MVSKANYLSANKSVLIYEVAKLKSCGVLDNIEVCFVFSTIVKSLTKSIWRLYVPSLNQVSWLILIVYTLVET